MKIELLPKDTLIIDYEKYSAWPAFKPIGTERIGGLWRAHFLKHALTADDLSCSAWRAPIPVEILKLLQSFADCHPELIEMAQAVPEIFIRWASWNPAFTVLAATYWRYRPSSRIPSVQTRVELWENLDPRDLLQYTRCEASKSFLKTLRKIPAEQCYEYLIPRLRDLWHSPENRTLLRHQKKITTETIWLLGCFPPNHDPGIHRLAAEQPTFNEFHIGQIIGDLTNRREINNLDAWPYRNRIHTWEQLLAAYDRFLTKSYHVPERFGPPPAEGVETEEIHIKAIRSRTALTDEAVEMSNCIYSYLAQIHEGKCYAYQLLKPERATVLIDRRSGRWSIAEAMIAANERQVKSSTWGLLINWVMSPEN